MKINHDNYESILIDYIDGTLNDVERAEVDSFLQQNPEIAEQICGFADVALSPNDDIGFDKKEDLLIVTLPNQEFEQWENTQPKLSKEHISYPHKQKLLKLGKRRTTQWTWYAMVACFVFALLVGRWIFETTEAELPQIAVLPIEPREIESEYEVRDTGYEITSPIAEYVANVTPRTTHHATSHHEPSEYATDSEQDNTIVREHLAIAMITPIGIPISIEKTIIKQTPDFIWDDHIEIMDNNMEILRRERLELAVNDFIIDPVKSVIHNVARRFFERRTEVELRLEEHEFPQFFARML